MYPRFYRAVLPAFRPAKQRLLTPLFLLLLAAALHAQVGLKTPGQFLPHQLGAQFTPHHLLTDYFEYLAGQSPATMRLQVYGQTNEARPLQIAMFSAPENIARLEEIRRNNRRLAGLESGTADAASPIAIVWLSMSVHGNEPSGAECSMQLAWELAAQTDPNIQSWLKNTVVILDPALNPDGYDRYTHWYRMASSKWTFPQPEAREHREPWPGGRTNHYYFDLNRDWAWATQVETRQRLKIYHDWLPHIHADLHEQYPNNPYYFAPAAEPMHDYITPWQRDFQTEIGKNHAGYFDKAGWLYFTKEVFDLFYPSYGDTYPLFNGAIGMTYEQAGHGVAGRAYLQNNDDTLTLAERIEHHLSTSRSTIEMGSKSARDLVDNFKSYYRRAAEKPQGKYAAYVLPANNDGNKLNQLCALLDRHQIRYGLAGENKTGVKAFSYRTGADTVTAIAANDLVISAYQPHSTLLQVLFEPESRLADSLTYDITAWALPFAYGIEAYALSTPLEPQKPANAIQEPEVRIAAKPYAWCIRRRSLADAAFLADLLQQGVRIRSAGREFALTDQVFEPGTMVITRADNMRQDEVLDPLVLAAAARHNTTLHPIFTGFASRGADLGSDAFTLIPKPEVAIIYGDEAEDNAYGHLWHFFEQELDYPAVPIHHQALSRIPLANYNVLVFPSGNYNLAEGDLKNLRDWVRDGGRLIALEHAVRAFADKEGFELKTKQAFKPDSADQKLLYREKERREISKQTPGAVVETALDPTHPLCFGLGNAYFSLKTTSNLFETGEGVFTPIRLEENYRHYGFIGSELKPQLEKTPVAAVQRMGRGEVLYFVDNPLFRSFWQQGKVLFCNALFN
ncbi:MAG: M14 family metallopeptidase [Saprospiraceae bacterium]